MGGGSKTLLVQLLTYYQFSLDIHISGGLIEHQYLVLPEQSSRQTHQLPLTNAEVGPSLCDLAMQLPLQLLDNWFQLNLEIDRVSLIVTQEACVSVAPCLSHSSLTLSPMSLSYSSCSSLSTAFLPYHLVP